MICLCFTVLSIWASRLRVIEGWYDRERLRVWAVCRSALLLLLLLLVLLLLLLLLLLLRSHSITFIVAHD